MIFLIFLILFQRNHVFIEEKGYSSEKIVIVEEELDGIDVNNIENLEDLLMLVFINKECGYLKVVADGGEVTRNIN